MWVEHLSQDRRNLVVPTRGASNQHTGPRIGCDVTRGGYMTTWDSLRTHHELSRLLDKHTLASRHSGPYTTTRHADTLTVLNHNT